MLTVSKTLIRAASVTLVAIGLASCDANPLQPGPTLPTADAADQPTSVTPLSPRCRLNRAAETARLPVGCVPRRGQIEP
jgi:hypothetical protein